MGYFYKSVVASTYRNYQYILLKLADLPETEGVTTYIG